MSRAIRALPSKACSVNSSDSADPAASSRSFPLWPSTRVEPVALERRVVAGAEDDGVVAAAGLPPGRRRRRSRSARRRARRSRCRRPRRSRSSSARSARPSIWTVSSPPPERIVDLRERRAVEVTAPLTSTRGGRGQAQRDAVGGAVTDDGQRAGVDGGQDRGLGGGRGGDTARPRRGGGFGASRHPARRRRRIWGGSLKWTRPEALILIVAVTYFIAAVLCVSLPSAPPVGPHVDPETGHAMTESEASSRSSASSARASPTSGTTAGSAGP